MRLSCLLIIAVFMTSCGTLPQEEPVTPIGAELRGAIGTGSYLISPSTTAINFVAGPTPGGYVEGGFAEFSGNISVDDPNLGLASLTAILNVKSASMQGAFFRDTLLGPGWFEAEVWPEARFEGQLAGWNEDGSGNFNGIMTLRDVAHEQTFRIVLTCDEIETCPEHAVGFEAQSVLDRTHYGMTRMLGMVGQDVLIKVSGRLMME